ncbi:MAG: YicC family protein [Tannerella sp.]|nr:YicC family protein [Tannerella sp.]
MIQSMTGFGKVVAELPNKKVTIEIKALNSKQLDLSTRVSPIYREKEMEIRSVISQRLIRGKIELMITTENVGIDIPTKISAAAVKSYKGQIEKIAEDMNIITPNDWFTTILRLPDVIKTPLEEADENEWSLVSDALDTAIGKLCDFRIQEGNMLRNIFETKAANIKELLAQIPQYEKERIDRIKARISENLLNLQEVKIDDNRLEQEMIYYIEKLDISEEKSRLDNHLKYFKETLDSDEGQGKKLGFIVQEIGREVNTIGSKSNHAEMQRIVVQMKDELEQIKEQVLNVL